MAGSSYSCPMATSPPTRTSAGAPTGIHDQRVQREGRQTFRLFQALRRQDELKLRVHMNIAAERLAEALHLRGARVQLVALPQELIA